MSYNKNIVDISKYRCVLSIRNYNPGNDFTINSLLRTANNISCSYDIIINDPFTNWLRISSGQYNLDQVNYAIGI
jgi:hypothetical protein